MVAQSSTGAPLVLPDSVRSRVVLPDSFPAAGLCIRRGASLEALQELPAQVSVNGPVLAHRGQDSANVQGWARPDSFRLPVKRRVRSVPVASSAVAVSNIRRPRKAQ